MDVKQYLRGLGIGILITAVILGISQKTEPMTDAQIKVRAAQLGMVEETVLADLATREAETEGNAGENIIPEETTKAKEEPSTIDSEQPSAKSRNETGEDTEKELQQETVSTEEENYILITVEQGKGSSTISSKLYEAGMIDSKEEYDEYLLSNGYDRKLIAGKHRIPEGATMEEITKILCGMQ